MIALGHGGSIVEQGASQEILSTSGAVQGLSHQLEPVETSPASILAPQSESTPAEEQKNELQDPSRRAGDWSVYRYYVQTAGFFNFLGFIAICSAFVTGSSFPCESSNKACCERCELTPSSGVVDLVDGIQRDIP